MTDFADGMGQKVSAHRGPVDDKQKKQRAWSPVAFSGGVLQPPDGESGLLSPLDR